MPPSRPDPEAMRFGVEAEFALVGADGRMCAPEDLTFAAVQAVVDRLDDGPYPDLARGDLGIKNGRWYVEGDERFDAAGTFLGCVPKGIETRTRPRTGIAATLAALAEQSAALATAAAADGYRLASIGWHPDRTGYRPEPPYNAWERAFRAGAPEYLAEDVFMLSYGPDLNLSHPDWDDGTAVDVARALTAASPALVPFSFSAPFAGGKPFGGLSYRTYHRTGRRPAVRVFVAPDAVPADQPSPPLVHAARIPSERGRVEFKAFDALPDPALYPALVAVVAGLALDPPPARAGCPDGGAHRRVALDGFDAPGVAAEAADLLVRARRGLAGSGLGPLLEPLERALATRRTPAHGMIDAFARDGVVTLPLVEPPSRS